MQSPAVRLASPDSWPPWGLRRFDGLRAIGFWGGNLEHEKTGGRAGSLSIQS